MVRVVGVRFKKAGKIYYFDPAELPVAVGCRVVVETARGVELGDVAVGPKYVEDSEVVPPLRKVMRLGTEKDAVTVAENKRREKDAFALGVKKILSHGLDMNLVDVEYTFDGSKIIFYFTAEGRVDFRDLVKDLASVFRTRIEMRQIGVRDEAKLLGGLGPCGRILCCTSFLGEFAPVSIRMAKDQNLSLNPTKISGLCGRLMCCLRYEQDTYEAAKKDPTQAPGYVPPVLQATAAEGAMAELEDDQPAVLWRPINGRPQSENAGEARPAPGHRRPEGGRPEGGKPAEQRRPEGGRPEGGKPAEQRRPEGGRPEGGKPAEQQRPEGGRPDRTQQPQHRQGGGRPDHHRRGGSGHRQGQPQGQPPGQAPAQGQTQQPRPKLHLVPGGKGSQHPGQGRGWPDRQRRPGSGEGQAPPQAKPSGDGAPQGGAPRPPRPEGGRPGRGRRHRPGGGGRAPEGGSPPADPK